MLTIKEYVPASEIWATAKDYQDKGNIVGYVRGYNVEVTTRDGITDWLSCEYTYDDPEEHFNDDFHQWYFEENQWTPTGRISFRGYGEEYYDFEEHDTFIKVVEV